jgi:hypothetical protein
MADSNIKKIRIKKNNLPNFIGNNDALKYEVRYRVVSDDKNKYSHWSPIHTLTADTTLNETGYDPDNSAATSIPYTILINSPDGNAQISWTMPLLLVINPTDEEKALQVLQSSIKEFDIYVQWEKDSIWGDWVWAGTSNGTQFSIIYPTDAEFVKFRIQKVTQTKEVFDAATYLITGSQDLSSFDSTAYNSYLSSIMEYL